MFNHNHTTHLQITGYQIRVVLRDVQPIVWRRFLLRSDNTFADLHQAIQIAFGWSGNFLYRFKLNAATIGSPPTSGHWTSDSVEIATLADFLLKENQRFLYEYNIRDSWQLDVRIEKLCLLDAAKFYPFYIGGKRVAPPESCGGPEQFSWLQEHYSPVYINRRMLELCSLLLACGAPSVDWHAEVEDIQLELDELRYWLTLGNDCIERRFINQRLKAYAETKRSVKEQVP